MLARPRRISVTFNGSAKGELESERFYQAFVTVGQARDAHWARRTRTKSPLGEGYTHSSSRRVECIQDRPDVSIDLDFADCHSREGLGDFAGGHPHTTVAVVFFEAVRIVDGEDSRHRVVVGDGKHMSARYVVLGIIRRV